MYKNGGIKMLSNLNKKRKLKDYLEQEKYSFPEIFENSPDILLYVVDIKGVIVSVRGDGIKLVGMGTKEIVGEKFQKFIYKEDIQKAKDYVTKVLNGESQYVKFRLTDGKGLIVPIDVTLTPIQLENKEIIGFYGLTHNISIAQQLEQKNLELQDKLRSIVHYSQEIIGIIDSTGTIIFQSISVESILGYKVEELEGRKSFDFIHPDDLPFAKQNFDDILTRPNTPSTIEFRLKHKNGEWRNFRVIHTNLLDNPNINGIVCNFDDITEIKK